MFSFAAQPVTLPLVAGVAELLSLIETKEIDS